MTTYEHAMLGVTGAMAVGLHTRFGWKIVAMAGIVAITPDWDGVTILGGMELFDQAHRAWGHNLFVASLVGCLCALCDYRFDLVGRMGRFVTRLLVRKQQRPTLQIRQARRSQDYLVWAVVGVLAALCHLPADMVVSGARGLSDWHLQLFWPFSRQGYVHSLVPWGDAGASIVFAGGMFAMLRWPTRLQSVAIVTLALVCIYIVARGAF